MKMDISCKSAALAVALTVCVVMGGRSAKAQQQGDGERSQYAGMAHVGGEVAAIAGSAITIRDEKGSMVQIVTTTNTRVMRGRGVAAKVSDVKVGDGIMAVGNLDGPGGTMHAAMLFATDAAQFKAMRENLGKTYIAGKVTAIDMGNATLTIERPDHVSQTIGLDANTSFRRGGRREQSGLGSGSGTAAPTSTAAESITLSDIKLGDSVRGVGALKDGVFVPTQLTVMLPGAGQGMRQGAPPA